MPNELKIVSLEDLSRKEAEFSRFLMRNEDGLTLEELLELERVC